MLRRLYIHNYKCFQNFTFEPGNVRSLLLVGKNGTGKTAIMEVLEYFQRIGRGEHRVAAIFDRDALTRWREHDICIFEIEAFVAGREYCYSLTLELPQKFTIARVTKETLTVDKKTLIERELASVSLNEKVDFPIDWHYFALSIIYSREENENILDFRDWLSRMLLLSPVPNMMRDVSTGESRHIDIYCENFVDYFIDQCSNTLHLYSGISDNMKNFFEDFVAIDLVRIGEISKRLDVLFGEKKYRIRFSNLSAGEKKFILHAFVLSICSNNEDTFIFWDEPDNYLANLEVQAFIRLLRSSVNTSGQIIMTTHNKQTSLCFSKENTFLMTRKYYLLPSNIQNIPCGIDFIEAIESLEI